MPRCPLRFLKLEPKFEFYEVSFRIILSGDILRLPLRRLLKLEPKFEFFKVSFRKDSEEFPRCPLRLLKLEPEFEFYEVDFGTDSEELPR